MSNKKTTFTDAKLLRQKAEEKLKNNQETKKTVLEADIKRLLHELQVHQIELEMQNEELRQANETAEAALKKFTMLYDFAPMGYFTVNRDGCIYELNFTGAEILCDKRFSLINSNFKLFITEEFLPVFNDFFRRIFNSKAKESCEVVLGYEDNILCPVYIEGIVTGNNGRCLLSVLDISEFKK
jgi:PAS domain-containing protein